MDGEVDHFAFAAEVTAPADADGGDLGEVQCFLGVAEGGELAEERIGACRSCFVQEASRMSEIGAAVDRLNEDQKLGGRALARRDGGVETSPA